MSELDERLYVGKRVQEQKEPAEEKIDKVLQKKGSHHKWWLWIVIPIVVAILLYGGATAYVMLGNRVLPHVSVLGVDMSNLTYEDAQKSWKDNEKVTYTTAGISFVDEGEEIGFESLEELRVMYTAEEAAETAWRIGHEEKLFMRGYRLFYQLFERADVMPETALDEEILQLESKRISEEVGCTVVEGTYFFDDNPESGEPGLYITKARSGRKLDEQWVQTQIEERVASGIMEPVTCVFDTINPEPVNIDLLYKEVKGPVVQPVYDRKTGTITTSKPGCEFKVEDVKAQYEKAIDGETFRADATVTFPRATTEEVEIGLFRDLLGTATTKVTGSRIRLGNVKLAASYINGKIYNPGESFWYNATVGERTTERGFGEAPAYFKGKTVMEVGGGICQVSSTLYYATLLANLKIVKRYAHAFIPAYIQAGCDATVSWNGPDFAFKNNTDYPIKIVTQYSADDELTVSIYGTKVEDTYVEIETSWLSKTDYETIYTVDSSLPSGTTEVDQTPYTGYHVQTYRKVYSKDGTLISSTFEADSEYEERNSLIRCAPDMMPVA